MAGLGSGVGWSVGWGGYFLGMVRFRVLRRPLSVRSDRGFAYRVPWHVDRSAPPVYRLVNTSRDVLRGVSVSVSGRARLRVSAPASVVPGDSVAATVSGPELERDTVMVVRWFQPDGREYLWHVSF
jgi:hypothetical protein